MDKFSNLIGDSCKVLQTIIGREGEIIKKVSNDNEEFYLKIASSDVTIANMKREIMWLKWLANLEIKVPFVVEDEKFTNGYFFLMNCMDGVPSHEYKDNDIVSICANAVSIVHSLKMMDFPCKGMDTLTNKLEKINELIKKDKINIGAFKDANNGLCPKEIYDELINEQNLFKSDTFTHGDLCMPNIIVLDKESVSLIDWADAGAGDKMRDISSLFKSIKRNVGEKYAIEFIEKCGMKYDDETIHKLSYFNKIDEFYYHSIKD